MPKTSKGFFKGFMGLYQGQVLHTMIMMMPEKAKAMPSNLLMRFLWQINKQGLNMNFLFKSMRVFVCARQFTLEIWCLIWCTKQWQIIHILEPLGYIITVLTVIQINYQAPPAVSVQSSVGIHICEPVFTLSSHFIVVLASVFTKTFRLRS